jgi:hypothetical protein
VHPGIQFNRQDSKMHYNGREPQPPDYCPAICKPEAEHG